MIDKIKKGIFPLIVALTALSVSASAAFYSVTGLSKLFAGATTEVIIMASSLELAKLVIASLLYRYWSNLNKVLRTYLTIACLVLVLITSMGIYGFLSSAYQDTYSELAIVENKKEFLNKKIDFYEKDLARYDKELETILININNLSTAKARSIQVRDTSSSTGVRNTISTSELRLAQKRIAIEDENKNKVQSLRQKTSDSLQKYKLEVLDLSNNSETAGELGPLKYLSGLTGAPMDKIINILLLVIIFVFDPLAISLVVAANFAFEKAFKNKDKNQNVEEKVEGMRKVVDKYDILEDEMEDWDNTLQDRLEDLDDEDDYPEPSNNLKEAARKYNEAVEEVDEIASSESETKDRPKDIEIEKPKVINTTSREAEVLYPNGKKKWIKKNEIDTNKIKYM